MRENHSAPDRTHLSAIALLFSAAALLAGETQAAAPLEGRTITGARVDSTDPSAVMEYDPNLNITWLRDWNVNGRMSWDAAKTWAAGLTVGSFSGWRLPFVVDTGAPGCDFSNGGGTDCGYNVQTKTGGTVYSEMAYLWYAELGNLAWCTPGDNDCQSSQPGYGLANIGDFKNLLSGAYWSGTEYAPNPAYAWNFHTSSGGQLERLKVVALYAVAARPGDVASPILEPKVWALMLMGLSAGAVALRRRTG